MEKRAKKRGIAQCFSQFRACMNLLGILLTGQVLTQWGCGGA